MSNIKRGSRRAVSALIAAGVLAGGLAAATVPSANAAGKSGGTLYFLTYAEGITHMDPANNYTGEDLAFVGTYLQRTLTAYKPAKGNAGAGVVGDLATNTGIPSNNAQTWKFTLRNGIKWEDGSAITCEDVKYGIARSFSDLYTDGPQYQRSILKGVSDYKGPYGSPMYSAAFNKAVACKGNTITFQLSKPTADFNYTLTLLNFSPVKKAWDTKAAYEKRVRSNGPYKISKYKLNDELVLVRNKYWTKASDPVRNAFPDKIVMKFGIDENLRDQRVIESKGLDAYAVSRDGLLPANQDDVFADPKMKDRRYNESDIYARYTAVNIKKLNCLEVRQAVLLALDRKGLMTLIGGTEFGGSYATGFISPILGLDYAPNNLPAGAKVAGNADAAKAKVEAAKAKGGACTDVVARATDPDRGLVIDLADTATNKKAFAIWEQSLKAAGLVLKANLISPTNTYYPTVMNPEKQNDFSGAGWGADWANASTVIPELFLKEGGFNLSQNWDDPAYAKFKAKVDQAMKETNRAKQAKLWKELNQYALDQVWAIPTRYGKTQTIWGTKVKGMYQWKAYGSISYNDLYVTK